MPAYESYEQYYADVMTPREMDPCVRPYQLWQWREYLYYLLEPNGPIYPYGDGYGGWRAIHLATGRIVTIHIHDDGLGWDRIV